MHNPPMNANRAFDGASAPSRREGGAKAKVIGIATGASLCAAFLSSVQAGFPADSGPDRLAPFHATHSAPAPSLRGEAGQVVATRSLAVASLSPLAVSAAAPVSEQDAGVSPAAESDAAASAIGEAESARAAIEDWAKAWSARDVARYLGAYARSFAPENGGSRDAWEQSRRQRIEGKKSISVALRDVQVEAEHDGRMKVSFLQDYAADGFKEAGTPKQLVLAKEDGAWRIVAETAPKSAEKSR